MDPETAAVGGLERCPIITYHLSHGCYRTVIDVIKPAQYLTRNEKRVRFRQVKTGFSGANSHGRSQTRDSPTLCDSQRTDCVQNGGQRISCRVDEDGRTTPRRIKHCLSPTASERVLTHRQPWNELMIARCDMNLSDEEVSPWLCRNTLFLTDMQDRIVPSLLLSPTAEPESTCKQIVPFSELQSDVKTHVQRSERTEALYEPTLSLEFRQRSNSCPCLKSGEEGRRQQVSMSASYSLRNPKKRQSLPAVKENTLSLQLLSSLERMKNHTSRKNHSFSVLSYGETVPVTRKNQPYEPVSLSARDKRNSKFKSNSTSCRKPILGTPSSDHLGSLSKWWILLSGQAEEFTDSALCFKSCPMASRSSQRDSFSKCWTLLDIAVCYLWIGPLVLAFWNNTWVIYDHYVFSNDKILSAWVSAALGYVILIIASLLQNHLLHFSTNKSRPVRFVIMCLYTYVMTHGCVSQWRGCWQVLDFYMGMSFANATLTYVAASAALLMLRCYNAAGAPPANITTDFPHTIHYQMTTFFSAQSGKLFILLDTLFTILVIGFFVISIWRGFWEMLDTGVYPETPHMSAIWTLVISFGLASVLLLLQRPSVRLSAHLQTVHWLAHLAFEDVITMLYTVVGITHWRGLWLLLDLYMPYRPHSLWVAHSLSFALLTLSMAANSILVRGCPRDGDSSSGRGVIPNTVYVRKLRSAFRTRRLQ